MIFSYKPILKRSFYPSGFGRETMSFSISKSSISVNMTNTCVGVCARVCVSVCVFGINQNEKK